MLSQRIHDVEKLVLLRMHVQLCCRDAGMTGEFLRFGDTVFSSNSRTEPMPNVIEACTRIDAGLVPKPPPGVGQKLTGLRRILPG